MAQIVRWLGALLTVAALIFVGDQIHSQASQLIDLFDRRLVLTLGAGAIFAAFCSIMLVASWNLTLTLVGRMRFDFTTAFSIYGRTQLLKYLPLNIFHLAGRYAMLRARGYEHRAIVGSTGAELGLAATSAVVLATLSDAWSLAQHLAMANSPPALSFRSA